MEALVALSDVHDSVTMAPGVTVAGFALRVPVGGVGAGGGTEPVPDPESTNALNSFGVCLGRFEDGMLLPTGGLIAIEVRGIEIDDPS
jgi:hypothetical protein